MKLPPNQALQRKNLPSLRYGNFSAELGRWAMKNNIAGSIALTAIFLSSCGEPYRDEGRSYLNAAKQAIDAYEKKPNTQQSVEKLFWNDCGREFTCLYLYETNNQKLVEAVVNSLLETQATIKHPGVKLTVYSSSHDEPKVIFHEISIK